MGYDLGLIATVAVCGWTAFDLFFASGRRRSLSISGLAATAALWAAGRLLIGRAELPAERELALQILCLGACTLAVFWLWVAAEAARPRWWQRAPWLLAVSALPGLIAWASLFTDGPGLVIDPAADPPGRGPLYGPQLYWSWFLVALGLFYFARAAHHLKQASTRRMALLYAGALTPLVGNISYTVLGLTRADWTPVLLGFSGLAIRYAIVESGVTRHLPLGHEDVADQLDVGILVADLEGCVVEANRAACELLETPDALGAKLEHLIEKARGMPGRSLEVRCFPLRSRTAEVGRAVVLSDRTEAEKTGRRLQLAARLEAIGSLTAGIAHEVNNPLAYIRANLSQLEKVAWYVAEPRRYAELPESVRDLAADAAELVAETQEGIERIARLVERLRAFAREEPEGGERYAIELATVATKAVAMARVGLDPERIVTRIDAVPAVLANEGDLVQIALNLLVNAIHASGDHGRIELEVQAERNGASLRVLDSGEGIPEHALPYVFDAFFTTKPEGIGSGLGLSLSADLARQHGGTLEAANRPEGGAVFTLWLPEAERSTGHSVQPEPVGAAFP